MENSTPFSAAAGGALIGLAATLLMAFNGRIAGISGVFSGSVFAEKGDKVWRLFFIAGLVAGPVAYRLVTGMKPEIQFDAEFPVIIVAGLLVGFGTHLGSGCTSGHGICGLSRLSPRSMVSVGLFMAAGMVTTGVIRHLLGL